MTNKIQTVELDINGVKVPAEVSIQVEEDYDYDLTDWEDERDRKAIKSGKFFVACIVVTAKALGVDGLDSLGACTLRPNNMFDSKPFEDDLNGMLTDHGMINNALDDLKNNIISQANLLKAFVTE